MKVEAAALFVGVLLLAACGAAAVRYGDEEKEDDPDYVRLTQERCHIHILKSEMSQEEYPLFELGNLCTLISRNRYRYNWEAELDLLCTGAPKHLRKWCEYMACHMSQRCEQFKSGSCELENVETKPGTKSRKVKMTPCPSKWLCTECLSSIFSEPAPGLFSKDMDRGTLFGYPL